MITVLDIETTSRGPKRSPSPFYPENYLVSVGYKAIDIEEYFCFKHDTEPSNPCARDYLDEQLAKTTLLIGHNIKFDLSWLLECGFEYSGKVYDTMIYEYLKSGGMHDNLDLSSCCRRYGISEKTKEITSLFENKIGFESIDWKLVEKYGRNDVRITHELFQAQQGGSYAKGS